MKKPILNVLQILAVTTLLVAATMAKAEVYKCTGADGKTAFSDQPCASGQKAAVIKPQISSAPAVLTDEQKGKAYDKIIELTAKKLDDPKFKELCRIARQRMDEIRKDKTGQANSAEIYEVNGQIKECDKRLGEYIGSELARAEFENKKEAATAAKQAIQAIADEPKRRQADIDCNAMKRDLDQRRELVAKLRSQEKPSDWPSDERTRNELAVTKLRAQLIKRDCPYE
jgi:hypothetical protein